MSNDTKHKIKLTELQMQLILETINKTPYLGIHSTIISNIRKKMTVKEKPEKGIVTDINQSPGGTA